MILAAVNFRVRITKLLPKIVNDARRLHEKNFQGLVYRFPEC